MYAYVSDSNTQIDPFGLTAVDAIFEMREQTFKGVNPTERVPRVNNSIDGLSAINNNEFIVNNADGKTYKFIGDDLNPIKDRGKGYKSTCS